MASESDDFEGRWKATLLVVQNWRSNLRSAGAAQLRRCKSPSDVEMLGDFHRLLHDFPSNSPVERRQLPLLVGLSAHLRGTVESTAIGAVGQLAGQLGRTANDKPVLSEARFLRLMAETDVEALYPQMIRVLRILNGNVSLQALWRGLAWWNTRTRRDWAYAYYEKN